MVHRYIWYKVALRESLCITTWYPWELWTGLCPQAAHSDSGGRVFPWQQIPGYHGVTIHLTWAEIKKCQPSRSMRLLWLKFKWFTYTYAQSGACDAKLKVLIGVLFDCCTPPPLVYYIQGPLQLCIVIATMMYWVRPGGSASKILLGVLWI